MHNILFLLSGLCYYAATIAYLILRFGGIRFGEDPWTTVGIALLPVLLQNLSAFTLVLLLLPVLLYTALWIRKGSGAVSYAAVRQRLQNGAAAYAVFLLLLMVAGEYKGLSVYSIHCFLLFVCISIYLLRILRSEGTGALGRRFRLLNALPVAGLLLACGLLISGPIRALFQWLLGGLYKKLLLPAIMVVVYLFANIGFRLMFFLNGNNPRVAKAQQDFQDYLGMEEIFGEQLTGSALPAWIGPALKLAVLLLILFIGIRLIRRQVREKTVSRTASAAMQRTRLSETSARTARKKQKIRLSGSAAMEIRESYRRYLRLCEKHGIAVDGSLASDQICAASEQSFELATPRKLRALWLLARYKEKDMTKEEALYARELLKELE